MQQAGKQLWCLQYICTMLFFNCNGKFYSNNTPIINAGNRGLRYGDGLFETMKMRNGILILEDEHFARLWKGMQVLQFTVPKHFTPDKLQDIISQTAIKNGHQKAARIRITIYRSDGGLYDAADHFPNYIIETWALPEAIGELNSNGLDVGIYTDVKKSCDILSNLKHNNYLPYVMAALYAKKQKWNDAVLLNNRGNICDSTIANIFFIKDEIIYTPALSEGCVAGVMRKYIIVQMAKIGFTCMEKEISVNELLNADEVFLSNSIYNLRWVKSIGESNFSNTSSKKIYSSMEPTIL